MPEILDPQITREERSMNRLKERGAVLNTQSGKTVSFCTHWHFCRGSRIGNQEIEGRSNALALFYKNCYTNHESGSKLR